MKKLISLILLRCCFTALGLCLVLRARQNTLQQNPPAEEQQSAVTATEAPAPVDTSPEEAEPVATAEPEQEAEIIPEESAPDYAEAYAPVFRSYQMWLAGNEPTMGGETNRGDYYLDLGETGISYLCRYVDTLGYTLTDMDGNGIAELLIGSEEEYQEKYIFDMFTLINGAPQRVIVSSERVAYMLYPGNRILHRGSGGASYNFMGIYRYEGTEIEMTEGVVMAGEDQYFEIVGESENIFSDRLPGDSPITREEYFARTEKMEATAIALQLQPLV